MSRMKLRKTIKISRVDKILIVLMIVMISTFVKIKTFSVKSNKILLNFARNQSSKIATTIINLSLKEVYDNDLSKIMKVKYDKNGNTVGVDFDNNKINKLNYAVNNNILKSIKKFENGQLNDLNIEYLDEKNLIYKVPIGVIYNIPVLVDISPQIPFKTSLLSSVESNIYTKTRDYGINNSLIEVYIKLSLDIQVILPFSSDTVNIVKEIPIGSKIIQGKIPQYYGGLVTNSQKQ